MRTVLILFWICAAVVFYTFFGYGIIIWIAVKIKERFTKKETFPVKEEYPHVTLLIAAYNEADIIAEKMQNCLSLEYPSDRLHFVWVTDGSTDGTPDLLGAYPQNTVLHSPGRCHPASSLR